MSRKGSYGNKRGSRYSKPKSTPLIVMSIVLLVLVGWITIKVANSNIASAANAVSAQQANGIQTLAMNLSAAGYSPNNITVKAGIPVRIKTNATADAGCVRGIMIPDFNINQPVNIGQDSFTFTPTKKGTFPFSCQMKMSKGTINVI